MPTSSFAEILARHDGPYDMVVWKHGPDPKKNKGLPFKYHSRCGGDPIAEAKAAIAGGAVSVDLWSRSEQQFVTTIRPQDEGDGAVRPGCVVAPAARKPRGGEYAVNPEGTDSSALPPTLFLTFEAFRERGAATVAEIAKDLGRDDSKGIDAVASHATRLKNMGFLVREAR